MASKKIMIVHATTLVTSTEAEGRVLGQSLLSLFKDNLFAADKSLTYQFVTNGYGVEGTNIINVPYRVDSSATGAAPLDNIAINTLGNLITANTPDIVIIGVNSNKQFYELDVYKGSSVLPANKTFIINPETFNRAVILPNIVKLIKG